LAMPDLHSPGGLEDLILERGARRDTRYVGRANRRLLRVLAVATMIGKASSEPE
jgi:hypothetical protein